MLTKVQNEEDPTTVMRNDIGKLDHGVVACHTGITEIALDKLATVKASLLKM